MTQKELLRSYAPLVNHCFKNEGKFIVDTLGKILLSNDDQLSFHLKKTQNLLNFLAPFISDELPSKIIQLVNDKNDLATDFIITNEYAEKNYFQILFTPIHLSSSAIIFIQIQEISKYQNLKQEHQKQLAKIENEMLLRTQEIIHTSTIMEEHGGYLYNFLRGLRHDLKSPITQLIDIIAYYKASDNANKKERAAVLIDNCLEKLQHTANGFSDFVDLHFLLNNQSEVCYFESIFQEIETTLSVEIEKANATIKSDFAAINQIYFNKKELTSIVYNLMSNALKFRTIDRPLKINIQTLIVGDKVNLTISDNGIGIDLAKYKNQLFIPFKRLTLDRPGAGIGLSMVAHILKRNDSQISIDSKLNEGSIIKINFPKSILVE